MLNIDETHFEQMVDKLNPKDPQLDKANLSGIEYLFLDLNVSISNDIILSKNYDKRDYFAFNIVNISRVLYGVFHVKHGLFIVI